MCSKVTTHPPAALDCSFYSEMKQQFCRNEKRRKQVRGAQHISTRLPSIKRLYGFYRAGEKSNPPRPR